MIYKKNKEFNNGYLKPIKFGKFRDLKVSGFNNKMNPLMMKFRMV